MSRLLLASLFGLTMLAGPRQEPAKGEPPPRGRCRHQRVQENPTLHGLDSFPIAAAAGSRPAAGR